jgi:hypothetical protein
LHTTCSVPELYAREQNRFGGDLVTYMTLAAQRMSKAGASTADPRRGGRATAPPPGAVLQRSKPRSRFVKRSRLFLQVVAAAQLFGFEGTYDVAEAPDHEDNKQRVPKVLKHYSPP